jgi:RNA polymerase sigma-70 factor, ECF subfamily
MVTSALPSSLIGSSLLGSNGIPADGENGSAAPARFIQDNAVTRAQAGDHDAFSELYTQHKRRVFAICMRMVRDFSLAEDLTQETFLQLHRKLTSFRGDSVFTTWLHRLAVNIVLMHLRKRALPVVSLDYLVADVPDERVGRSFGTRDLTQAGVVDRLAIERAVAALAPGYRCIYVLHDVEGYAHCEIASMQDCTLGNSKSQLHKARRVLRGVLGTQAGMGEDGSETIQ